MIEKKIKRIKKGGTLVLFPKESCEYQETFDYMFENSIEINETLTGDTIHEIARIINSKELEQLILIDYIDSYGILLPLIKGKTNVKLIFTSSVANFTNTFVLNNFKKIINFYNFNLIKKIGCFDYNLYITLKKAKYLVEYIMPDIKINKTKPIKSSDIAIIGNDYDPNNNYYNMLSALKLVDYKRVKVRITQPVTQSFINLFDIKAENIEDDRKLQLNNELNLYVNFTNSNISKILKSMDSGIPCIVGNVEMFDDNEFLKKMLVVKGDDNINDIASKIDAVRKNKKLIIEEYLKFRKKYSKKAETQFKKFMK